MAIDSAGPVLNPTNKKSDLEKQMLSPNLVTNGLLVEVCFEKKSTLHSARHLESSWFVCQTEDEAICFVEKLKESVNEQDRVIYTYVYKLASVATFKHPDLNYPSGILLSLVAQL